MLFGAHVSIAGGLLKALDYAESVGCECMQIFAKSPRQWHGPPTDPQAGADFSDARKARGMGPVFTHTAYLINLATDDEALRERSIAGLADEIRRGALLGVDGVVTHVGTDPLGDAKLAAGRVGDSVRRAFDLAGSDAADTRLLLENTAGAGRTFGASVSELASCLAAAGMTSERVGICLDTCHAFAQGSALDTGVGWDALLSAIEKQCGLNRLGLIHGNDCMFERGSKRDRHAWIGDGFIGLEGFRCMVCHPMLVAVPVCTEMPGEVPDKDSTNIARLKTLRDECSTAQPGGNRPRMVARHQPPH